MAAPVHTRTNSQHTYKHTHVLLNRIETFMVADVYSRIIFNFYVWV